MRASQLAEDNNRLKLHLTFSAQIERKPDGKMILMLSVLLLMIFVCFRLSKGCDNLDYNTL